MENEIKSYDMAADRERLTRELVGSSEIDDIVSSLNLYDTKEILRFGEMPTLKLSSASDEVLRRMGDSQLDESHPVISDLARAMEGFNPRDFEEKKGFLGKVFANPEKRLTDNLDKYQRLGDDLDRIYVRLKGQEASLRKTNRLLEDMLESTVEVYHDLLRYIFAGDQACRELSDYLKDRDKAQSDIQDRLDLSRLKDSLKLLERRTHDLKTSELVVMQTIPAIRMLQYGNERLLGEMESAFSVTLPIFRQALSKAVVMKRQSLRDKSLSAVESKAKAQIAADPTLSSSEIDTRVEAVMGRAKKDKAGELEEAWRSILEGIERTKRLQEEERKNRINEARRLEEVKRVAQAKKP